MRESGVRRQQWLGEGDETTRSGVGLMEEFSGQHSPRVISSSSGGRGTRLHLLKLQPGAQLL